MLIHGWFFSIRFNLWFLLTFYRNFKGYKGLLNVCHDIKCRFVQFLLSSLCYFPSHFLPTKYLFLAIVVTSLLSVWLFFLFETVLDSVISNECITPPLDIRISTQAAGSGFNSLFFIVFCVFSDCVSCSFWFYFLLLNVN